jgi:DNA polymerase V
MFTDPLEQQKRLEMLDREKRRQQAVIHIKRKYGKNAILKGMNYQEGATTRQRNGQVGGHKA